MQSTYTPEEIQRRLHDFDTANHRDHAKFILGFAIAGAALTGMFLAVSVFLYG